MLGALIRLSALCSHNSDGVGFETICYYLIIDTIKDLYCAGLREIATTCNPAVTNCHGICFIHLQSEILPDSLSPFENYSKRKGKVLMHFILSQSFFRQENKYAVFRDFLTRLRLFPQKGNCLPDANERFH